VFLFHARAGPHLLAPSVRALAQRFLKPDVCASKLPAAFWQVYPPDDSVTVVFQIEHLLGLVHDRIGDHLISLAAPVVLIAGGQL